MYVVHKIFTTLSETNNIVFKTFLLNYWYLFSSCNKMPSFETFFFKFIGFPELFL